MRLRFFSDLHVGSPTGVWPPGIRHERKFTYRLNPAQRWLWNRVLESRDPPPDLVFFCGDLMDLAHGVDLDDIQRAASKVVDAVAGDLPKYFVEGTTFHEKWYEGVIGRVSNVKDDKVFDILELTFEGRRFNIAHHPESGGGVIYKSTILGRTVMFAAVASAAGKVRMPDVIIRGHLHHYALYQDTLSTYVQLPCFCLQDAYARKKRYYGWKPDIGYVDIIVEKGGIKVDPKIYKYPI